MTDSPSNMTLPQQMEAVVATSAGGSEVLHTQNVPLPTPGTGEVLIKIAATGLNFIETYQRSGQYPVQYPAILGSEASGVVVALGPGVTEASLGDRVTTASASSGTYAQYCTAPEGALIPVPEDLELSTACAASLQGLTAHYLMTSVYPIQAGDDVLIHAGAGGVGQIAIQMLRARGARVFTTVSTPEKGELARQAGAHEVLGYEDFDVRVREVTDGAGVKAVFDGVGKDTFEGSLRSLATRGTLALFGAASGPVPPFDPQRLNALGSLILTRPSLAHFLVTPEERAWRAQEVFEPIAQGTLKVNIGDTYPLSDAGAAQDALTSRATTGKVLLIPSKV